MAAQNDHSMGARLLGRKLSRVLTMASEQVEQAVEDTTGFLNIQHNVQDRADTTLEREGENGAAQAGGDTARGGERKVSEQVGRGLLDPKQVMLRDKMVFWLGVVNVGLIGFWMGRSPHTYYHYWTVKCVVLFTLRWWVYRKKGWHYLMLELCYFANAIGAFALYFAPHSPFMRKLAYSFMAGPLMFSILAMRNSLVFHDFERTTTLMMHASPAIVAWALRWRPDPAWLAGMSRKQVAAFNSASWGDMILVPVAFYLLWVLSYYLFTFVLLRHRIEGRGRTTMFALMVPKDREGKARRSPLARIVLRAPPAVQPLAYLGVHAVAATLTFLPIKIFWDHFWVHTAALLMCLGWAVWNGGSFYFTVFAKRYVQQLEAQARGDRVRTTSDKEA